MGDNMIVNSTEIIIETDSGTKIVPRTFVCDDINIGNRTYVILDNLQTKSEKNKYVYYNAVCREDSYQYHLMYLKSNANNWDITKPDVICLIEDSKSVIEQIAHRIQDGESVKSVARRFNISYAKAVKIMSHLGLHTNETHAKIHAMLDAGKTQEEIRNTLGISKSTYSKYVSYTKGLYNLPNATENAHNIRECRNSKEKS